MERQGRVEVLKEDFQQARGGRGRTRPDGMGTVGAREAAEEGAGRLQEQRQARNQ